MDRKPSLLGTLVAFVLARLLPRPARAISARSRAEIRADWARSRHHWAGGDK